VPAKRIVVVSIDRLNAGYLGPWGNTWVETPALDSLAAKSFLWDRALIDSPSLANIFHGLWNGRHAVGLPASALKAGQRPASLPQQLAAQGYSTMLVHDEPALAQHPLHDDWQQIQQLTVPAPTKLAAEISSSYWSEFFGTAISLLEQAPQRSVVWLHSGALNTLWDAPLELREHYNDPEDPPPQDNAQVPRLVLPADYDPDLLLEISHAYAAQIGMLDTCLEALGEAIDERSDASDTLFVLLGTRGMPLGEHRRVGAWDDRLYAELVQTPLLVSWPERFRSPGRSDELAQLPDLFPTLLEAAGAETREHQFSRSLWPTVDMRPAAVASQAR
jgi:arylsulfatase A-like enzyme